MGSGLEHGKGTHLWHYWTVGEGAAKWMSSPKPWTTLRDLLIKEGVPADEAPGLATNIMRETPAGAALYDAHHNSKADDMPETFTRVFTSPELEILTRANGGDGRTVAGLAVPYGVQQRINSKLTESFRRGAFNAQLKAANRIPFSREHMRLGGTLIGKAVQLRDDANGLYGEFRVSATPAGDETLELIKDGALQDLSIGFREGQNLRSSEGIVERVTAQLIEVSVVLEGAYGEAATVTAVREAEMERHNLAQAKALLAGLPLTMPNPGSLR